MLASKEEIKSILQIPANDNTKDELIDLLIPVIQDFICTYCNNYFTIQSRSESALPFRLNSSTISFSAQSVKLTNDDFTVYGFADNMHLKITGSALNDGIYKIISVITSEIIVEETFQTETPADNYYIELHAVSFPQALKLIAAKFIAYEMNKYQQAGETQHQLGDLVITISPDYPQSLLRLLRPYQKLAW